MQPQADAASFPYSGAVGFAMPRQRIGELLLAAGLVSDADLGSALALQAETGGLVGQILVRLGAVSEARLLEALSGQLSIAVLNDDEIPAAERIAGFLAGVRAPAHWWADRQAAAWRTGDEPDSPVICAAANPLDPVLRDRMSQAVDGQVAYRLASRAQVAALTGDLDQAARTPREGAGEAARLRELAQETPVIDFVNGVFAEALARRASDVHVEPFEDQFFVRMRVDGMLVTARRGPRSGFDAVCSRIKLLSGMDIGERRLPQDGRQTIRVSGQQVDLRVSTLPSTWGESVVLRLLGKSNRLPDLGELGLEAGDARRLLALAEQPNGVLLVSGPTGSGKTTTIYRLLTHLNDGVRKIVTVEDPVEFDLPGVVQVYVRGDIGLTFAAGLRAMLRQDPDVIMVGEIRDPETAKIAVQAALTGHLVISTVHTNSALAAVSRLLDLGVEDYLLADVLRGVVGQRLVRKLCPHCAVPSSPEDRRRHEAAAPAGVRFEGPAAWREPVGCESCVRTGFLGRIGLFEMAAATKDLERDVRAGADEDALTATARSHGFVSLFEDGYVKARAGLTTLAEVHRVAGLRTGQAAEDAA
jgi:general secretion pathway protein E